MHIFDVVDEIKTFKYVSFDQIIISWLIKV